MKESQIMKTTLLILVLSALLILPVQAAELTQAQATLSLPEIVVYQQEQLVSIPIEFTSGAPNRPAAINLEIFFPERDLALQSIQPGAALIAANKELYYHLSENGILQIVIYGLNQDVLDSGVLATLEFAHLHQIPGLYPVQIGTLVAASAHAQALDILPISGSIRIAESSATFLDVPSSHWAYTYIETLYAAGFTRGCNLESTLYCPETTLSRQEAAVFTMRGNQGAEYLPPTPSLQIFSDVELDRWSAGWVNSLWEFGYTAGCALDPLKFCPDRYYTQAEAAVLGLRCKNGYEYTPPAATGLFRDVPSNHWGRAWLEEAYRQEIVMPCQTEPELWICPENYINRAMAAYIMVQANGLTP